MDIKTAVVSFFNTRGKMFGFAVTEDGKQVYLGEKTYRRPSILPDGSFNLRLAGNPPSWPKPKDTVHAVVRTAEDKTFAIAWCTAQDVTAECAKILERRKRAAEEIFGAALVEEFEELIDVCKKIRSEFVGVKRKALVSSRTMPKNMILEPERGLIRGTREHWLAITKGGPASGVEILKKSGRLIDRLNEAGAYINRETNMPFSAREFVLVKLVERPDSLDCFVYRRTAEEASASSSAAA